ncbi:acylphosphatase [Lusitaniella coriacea]|uniref:acylphosphatase n=1 Tax=Lusitaniella coriacea TaxID=1983105 RepID=UPI003CF1A1D4
MKNICAHVWISGTVQGVGYRYSTAIQAKQLGVRGWVRNLPDGRVEAMFEGDRAQVEQMINWCNRGPSAAVVQNIEVEWEQASGIEGFTTRY